MRDAEVRYAVRDGTRLAYEVFGTGSCDIVLFQSVCPIDLMWDLPELASFLETLGTIGRVIAYDPRGLGASDPSSDDGAAIIETHADDLFAVLSASGSRRATIFDLNYGLVSSVFAATYPQHVRSLIMCHLRTSFPELHSFSGEQRQQIALARLTTESLEVENPRVAHDPVLRQWWARSRRLLHSPYSVLRNIEIALRIDTTAALPAVRAPTLVLHRRDLVGFDIETSRELASHIPGAQFVELPGSEEALFLGDTAPVFAVVAPFIHQEDTEVANDDRTLATVLFTDMVASTAQLAAIGDAAWRRVLDAYDDLVDRAVASHRGHVVKKMGDGVLATFDGPARAVHCAAVIRDGVAEHGVMVRSGLHTGEIERRVGDVAGIAVHIASRVAALAEPGEIWVSRTVVDLAAGSGIDFQARGDHQLKGCPGIGDSSQPTDDHKSARVCAAESFEATHHARRSAGGVGHPRHMIVGRRPILDCFGARVCCRHHLALAVWFFGALQACVGLSVGALLKARAGRSANER